MTVVTLPAARWLVTVTVRAEELSCVVNVDDGAARCGTIDGRASCAAPLSQGRHTVSVDCTGQRAYRGCAQPRGFWTNRHDEFEVALDVRREWR